MTSVVLSGPKCYTSRSFKSLCGQLQLVQLTTAKSALQSCGLLLTSYGKHWVHEYRVFRILIPFLRRSFETLGCFAPGSGESGYPLDCRKRGVDLENGTTKDRLWSVLSYCCRAVGVIERFKVRETF